MRCKFCGELVGLERREIAVQADARRVPGDEMQIRAAALHELFEKRIDLRHPRYTQLPVGWILVASRRGSMLVSVTNFWNMRLSVA